MPVRLKFPIIQRREEDMTDAQMISIIVAIVGVGVAVGGLVVGSAFFMFRQMNMVEERQRTERHESERRLTELIKAVESRLTNQLQEVGTRQITERHESERRLTELIKAVEERSIRRVEESGTRLVALYREVNRDTKTLIGEVQFIRGRMELPPHDRESDSDATAEAAY